jgi:outer membrane immunogenic protein
MKKHIAIAASAMVALAVAGSANAADMPAPVYQKAPPPIMQVYSWTGFYIGLNGGYSWGRSTTTGNLFNDTTGVLLATATNKFNLNGGVFGGQAGYNWQSGNFVFGVEGDIQWSDERGNTAFTCALAACLPPAIVAPLAGTAAVALNQKIDWFATLRGRLGVTVTPTVLLYGTSGLAYGDVKTAAVISGFNANFGAVSAANSTSSANAGWTVGAGIEGQLVGNWTGKLEYLYMDLGTFTGSGTLLTSSPALRATFSSHITDQILRAGINYRF